MRMLLEAVGRAPAAAAAVQAIAGWQQLPWRRSTAVHLVAAAPTAASCCCNDCRRTGGRRQSSARSLLRQLLPAAPPRGEVRLTAVDPRRSDCFRQQSGGLLLDCRRTLPRAAVHPAGVRPTTIDSVRGPGPKNAEEAQEGCFRKRAGPGVEPWPSASKSCLFPTHLWMLLNTLLCLLLQLGADCCAIVLWKPIGQPPTRRAPELPTRLLPAAIGWCQQPSTRMLPAAFGWTAEL
jgi:hypothetical protein